MSSRSKKGSRIIAALFSMTLILALSHAFAYEGPPQDGSCNGAFQGDAKDSLAKLATRNGVNLPDGSIIHAGEQITFTFTWETADWSTTDKLFDCFAVNGVEYHSLDYGWKPVENNGSAQHTITVPALNDGDSFCDRARLSGTPTSQNPFGTQKSNEMCFTVRPGETTDDGGTDGTPSDDGQTDGTPSDDGQTDGTPNDDGQTDGTSNDDGQVDDGTPTDDGVQADDQQVDGNDDTEVLGQPPLVKTGSETIVLAAVGMLMLTGGALLTVISRRKEGNEVA
jgi:LPXTG-motif cell wall-anchored protein